MTSTRTQTMEACFGSRSSNGLTGWPWLALGVAAILALAAWGALDSDTGTNRLDSGTVEQSAVPETQPVFDGRGKWGGYAR